MVDPGGIGEEEQAGLSPGTQLGKYEIVRLLGAGGMGAVYEAVHSEIGKRVAIKVLSPAIAAVPGARARFLREAQLTSRVRHPNIVDVTDMGSDKGQTYLVMEFLRGEDLAQRLARTGPFAVEQLADIMLPVCAAVVEAHKVGVTHRDLKPQNIFLAVGPHSTQPKVLDFGISKGVDVEGVETLTGTGAMIGTPFYLAPEQIVDARAAGPASDQYALGVIMYECLTGHRPFEAENLFVVFQAIVGGHPVPPGARRAGIPAAMEAIVLRAMDLDPKARFGSAVALGRALLPFASGRTRSAWEDAFVNGEEPGGVVMAPVGNQASAPARAHGFPANRPTSEPHVSRNVPGNVSAAADSSAREGAPDLGVRRSRVGQAAVILGVAAVVGLVGGVVLRRYRFGSGTRDDVATATASQASAIAPKAPPAAPEVRAPRTFQVSVGVKPETAAIELDGRQVGRGRFDGALPLDGVRHRLRVTADDYDERVLEFADEPPPSTLTLQRSPGVAVVKPVPSGVRVSPPRPLHPGRRPHVPQSTPSPRVLNPNGAPVID
jgi:serine/threonine protein kinase